MMRLLLAVALVTGVCTAGSAGAGSPDPASPVDRQRSHVVTLITGDRVRMAGDARHLTITPGPGRRQVRFHTHRTAGTVHVVPSDMAGLVAAGRLDQRLFDVKGLIAAGYDDARASDIGLIVSRHGPVPLLRSSVTQVRELPSLNVTTVRVPKARASEVLIGLTKGGRRLLDGVEKVWLDGKRRTSLDQSVRQIGAPAAWQAGLTGRGVTVAVLDGGIDATHPDLAGRVIEARNFTDGPAGDTDGHGTHVASTIAGSAAASAGRYRGVAPDVRLLDGKVCDGRFCPESSILAGMQWAATEQRADVINMSLGGTDLPGVDPLEDAVNTLTAQTGSLFVVASGNNGPQSETVASPGSADAALTVGAVDKADGLADFSGRGPRVGDGAVKPDVTAPGVDIVAAKAEQASVGEPVGDHYLRLSGTSMATPHVAGAAALLVQQHPGWTPAELKAALMGSAKPHESQSAFEQGAGRVDVAEAINRTVVSQPGSVSFGVARWPHEDDSAVSRQLTYRNLGDTTVTLALQVSLTGPDGAPAPAEAVTVSATSATLSPGGSASVTVTSNTRHGGPDGSYSGRITAIAGATRVVTPIAVGKEVESYDLTVAHLGRDGQPVPEGTSTLDGIDHAVTEFVGDVDGVVQLRLPKGRYSVAGFVPVSTEDGRFETHHLIQPVLQLDRNRTVAMDARITKPVNTTVPRTDARLADFMIGVTVTIDTFSVSSGLSAFDLEGIYTAPLGDPLPADQLVAHVASQWARPGENWDFTDSPYSYGLMNLQHGRYFHGFDRAVTDDGLAKLTVHLNAQVPGRLVGKAVFGRAAGVALGSAMTFSHRAPATMTQYLDAGPVQWFGLVTDLVDDHGLAIPVTELYSTATTYRPGSSYRERWNAAAFGPMMARWQPHQRSYAIRTGNDLAVNLPMFSDQDGHAGFSETDTSSTTLYRNGELVGESNRPGSVDALGLPAGRGTFRLETTATRPSVSALSTRIAAAWTFASEQAPARGEALPLWSVRYLPPVDAHNVVKRLPVSVVPVRVEAVPGSPVGQLRAVDLQVSGDAGSTWTKATLQRLGTGRYLAVFDTPEAEHVSLRVKAADSSGNAIEQTIIHAYRLG